MVFGAGIVDCAVAVKLMKTANIAIKKILALFIVYFPPNIR